MYPDTHPLQIRIELQTYRGGSEAYDGPQQTPHPQVLIRTQRDRLYHCQNPQWT